MNRRTSLAVAALCFLLFLLLTPGAAQAALTPEQQLGKFLFFDTDLSTPKGMACATCHAPEAGFADPRGGYPVSQGVLPQFFGDRNAPTASYAAFIPPFHYSPGGGGGGGMGGGGGGGVMTPGYVGGQFWDGRAATIEEQAKGPFLNPLEMRNPNKTTVVVKVRKSDYAALFRQVYGANSLKNVESAYDLIAEAIGEYERSTEVSPFTSKFDYFRAGHPDALSADEIAGMDVYNGKGKCSTCHPLTPMGGGMGGGGGGMGGGGMGGQGPMGKVLLTDFRYKNLGTPANPLNPFYKLPRAFNPLGDAYVDLGLGATLRSMGVPEEKAKLEDGKLKTPTLRNVAETAPYMHNGVFSNLAQVVHFYNTGMVLLGMGMESSEVEWPPEVNVNIEPGFVGGLDLTPMEGMALVEFLKTLTDGYQP